MSSADRPDRALAALRRHEREQPELVERYERLEELGRGASGAVHRARDRELDRFVALKLLSPAAATRREVLERFRREAESLARLSHPHIVKVLDLVESPPAIVLELVEGRSLAALLAGGGLDRSARLLLVEKVARAIEHAHALGIVHRDLKPSNILVTTDLEPKVADFGVAHLVEEGRPALTSTTAFLGTPHYMAPEQATGSSRLVDARTDVHALGVVLYELLTGQLPYHGETPTELLARIIYATPEPPRRLDPTIPAALQAVVLRAMEKRPERRFQTARELADALARCRAGSASRGRWAARAVLALLLLASAGLAGIPAPARAPAPLPPAPAPARPDLEARLRAGLELGDAAGELAAIAAAGSAAELLDRLARDAVVLPLDALRRAEERADTRCRAPLAVLEAVARLVAGEPPERARARLKGVECRGLALTFLDVCDAVARVRLQVVEPGRHAVFSAHGLVDADALAPLERLAGRPDLLAAAVAPLASECRTDLVVRMTLGTPLLEQALARARCLEPVLERLPPGVAAAWVTCAARWDLASRLAPTLAAKDPLLAGHCAAMAFRFQNPARPVTGDPDLPLVEATLLPFVEGGAARDPEELSFANRTLYVVSRDLAGRTLREAFALPPDARRAALERARAPCRAAFARCGYAVRSREFAQDAHRLASIDLLLGDPEAARRTEALDSDDPLGHLPLPADLPAVVAAATRVVEQDHVAYVSLSLALALRARAKALLGDAGGAAVDDGWLDTLQNVDAWLDRELAARLIP